jgi:hypothetical protein
VLAVRVVAEAGVRAEKAAPSSSSEDYSLSQN